MHGTIRKTKDGYQAVFERRLDAPPEKVWRAITEPEHLQHWYVRTELDPRVGGHYAEHHDHVGISMEGKVTRFEPPRAFEHTWWGQTEEDVHDPRILWEVIPEGTGTRLVMTYSFAELEGAHMAMAGWHVCLNVLGAVLAGDDPDHHAPPRGTFSDGTFTVTEPGKGHWVEREALEAHYMTLEQGTAGP